MTRIGRECAGRMEIPHHSPLENDEDNKRVSSEEENAKERKREERTVRRKEKMMRIRRE